MGYRPAVGRKIDTRDNRLAIGAGVLVAIALAVLVWGALGAVALLAVSIALIAFLGYLSFSSTDDREREEAAREEFERTGRWPEDD